MGSVSNNPASSNDARISAGGDRPETAAGDGVERDAESVNNAHNANHAKEADEWLAGGAEEAGYGYGV